MRAFGITPELKRENRQYWDRELGMCWQLLVVELCKHAHENFAPALRFGDDELGERARLVYSNLGQWLSETSESHVEEEYYRLGKLRHGEGIPLSQVVMALLLTRRNMWNYVESTGGDTILDLRQQLDLELMVVRFFDRAIHHTVRGYEAVAWAQGD